MFSNIVDNTTECNYNVLFLLRVLYRRQSVNAHRGKEGHCLLSSKIPSLNTFNYFNY